jgi:hypothetical protein
VSSQEPLSLTTEQQRQKIVIREAREALAEAASALSRLLRLHRHLPVEGSFSGAECAICEEDLGWWCPDSPHHLCVYKDSEFCIHCGQPSERQ